VLLGVVFLFGRMDFDPFFCFLSCLFPCRLFFLLFIYSITDIFLSGRGCYLLPPPSLLVVANINFNQSTTEIYVPKYELLAKQIWLHCGTGLGGTHYNQTESWLSLSGSVCSQVKWAYSIVRKHEARRRLS
jgi:hypothetical protein